MYVTVIIDGNCGSACFVGVS